MTSKPPYLAGRPLQIVSNVILLKTAAALCMFMHGAVHRLICSCTHWQFACCCTRSLPEQQLGPFRNALCELQGSTLSAAFILLHFGSHWSIVLGVWPHSRCGSVCQLSHWLRVRRDSVPVPLVLCNAAHSTCEAR